MKWGTVLGKAYTTTGAPVKQPVAIVEKEGKPYCWSIGQDNAYTACLPEGMYSIQVTAKNYAPSTKVNVAVKTGMEIEQDFSDLQPPGEVIVKVSEMGSGKPLDARIKITGGQEMLVRYLGVSTVYTDLENIGTAKFPIAPGNYTFNIDSGGGFVSRIVSRNVEVKPGKTTELSVLIETLVSPRELGWYCADLHHHSNILDGVTPPRFLVESQLASRLDFTFVSDHDSVARHYEVKQFSDMRGVPFIPSVEISPSWGHINVYPLPLGKDVLYRGTASEIFKAARDAGALVIQINHPYIEYGYFYSWEKNEIPGGFDPNFDIVEINGPWTKDDNKTLTKVWSFWNEGKRYYLGGGSDTHDVWSELSGYPRTYVYISGTPSVENFVLSLKAGHSFVSYGPLVFPKQMFGETFSVKYGSSFDLEFEAVAVDGLKDVLVISQGKVVDAMTFQEPVIKTRLSF